MNVKYKFLMHSKSVQNSIYYYIISILIYALLIHRCNTTASFLLLLFFVSFIQQKKQHIQLNTDRNTYTPATAPTIFTNVSRTATGGGVSLTYCVTKGTLVIHHWAGRLDNNYTVYQAELCAILEEL